MSDIPITERQQYWLDHIRPAEAFDGSLADYARSEDLKPKELYFWMGILARRGLLDDSPSENNAGFVRVIDPTRPLGMARRSQLRAARGAGPLSEPTAMIRPSGDVRIHLYRQPVDMRKAVNGWCRLSRARWTRIPSVPISTSTAIAPARS
jgi:hypothetical protein